MVGCVRRRPTPISDSKGRRRNAAPPEIRPFIDRPHDDDAPNDSLGAKEVPPAGRGCDGTCARPGRAIPRTNTSMRFCVVRRLLRASTAIGCHTEIDRSESEPFRTTKVMTEEAPLSMALPRSCARSGTAWRMRCRPGRLPRHERRGWNRSDEYRACRGATGGGRPALQSRHHRDLSDQRTTRRI